MSAIGYVSAALGKEKGKGKETKEICVSGSSAATVTHRYSLFRFKFTSS